MTPPRQAATVYCSRRWWALVASLGVVLSVELRVRESLVQISSNYPWYNLPDDGPQPMPSQSKWDATKRWLCPDRVPNLTAAAAAFRTAQLAALPPDAEPLPRADTDAFFSFWPGHATAREPETNRTATFLRTYKCGSMTVHDYFRDDLGKGLGFAFESSLRWDDFQKAQARHRAQSPSCLFTTFRDPVSHFFSGIGELEMRRRYWKKRQRRELPYEKLPIPSHARMIGFLKFVLSGSWEQNFAPDDLEPFRHIFPQSGYLVNLNRIGYNLTAYLHMSHLSEGLPAVLRDNCGFSAKDLPPVIRFSHNKISGMDEMLRQFWGNGSSLEDAPNHRWLESICLLHSMDYACLAAELTTSVPSVCSRAFEKYLPPDGSNAPHGSFAVNSSAKLVAADAALQSQTVLVQGRVPLVQGRLPTSKKSQADDALKLRYLSLVYNERVQSPSLFDKLEVIYRNSSVALPLNMVPCRLFVYGQDCKATWKKMCANGRYPTTVDLTLLADRFWPTRKNIVGDFEWLEVTRRKAPEGEGYGCFFHARKGTGIFINVKKSLVLHDDDDAKLLFNVTKFSRYADYCVHARKMGYDSVQIANSIDAKSNEFIQCTGACETEKVEALCIPGVELRTGINHDKPCKCDESYALLNCGNAISPKGTPHICDQDWGYS